MLQALTLHQDRMSVSFIRPFPRTVTTGAGDLVSVHGADLDSGREGKPGTEKPKDQLPSCHLTTAAKPLRTQPHSQSESVHDSGGIVFGEPLADTFDIACGIINLIVRKKFQ